jgi:hypothetical protein
MKAAFITFSITIGAMILAYGPLTSSEHISDERLVSRSDLIVTGKITRLISGGQHDASSEGAVIRVDQVLKGSRGLRTVRLCSVTGDNEERSGAGILLQENQEGIWLLRRSEKPGYYIAEYPGSFKPFRELDDIKTILERNSQET